MKLERIVPGVLLVGFSALTAEVVFRDGYTGWLRIAFSSLSAGILLVDLSIALSLVLFWMIKDARRRGMTVWPYAVLTVLLGSVGPLAYLVVRSFSATQRARYAPRAPKASTADRRADDTEEGAPRGLRLERHEPLT
jgi:hypothetical protein